VPISLFGECNGGWAATIARSNDGVRRTQILENGNANLLVQVLAGRLSPGTLRNSCLHCIYIALHV